MRKTLNVVVALTLILPMLAILMITTSQESRAQSLQGMSCEDLWVARNQIYAAKGYCFKTQRARAAFGPGCYPPYGRLNHSEQARVNRIKQAERRRGCRVGNQGVAPPIAPPQSSPYANMGCNALWYERNAIYARNGHCFNTARGRQNFGPGCFPPYGRLGRSDQRRVNQIQQWERRRRCR